MADERLNSDQPAEDSILNADLPFDGDADDVSEDVINVRPNFQPRRSSGAASPKRIDVQPAKEVLPGKTRERDPLDRDKVAPNKLAAARDALNDRVKKGADDIRQARDLAGQKIDKLRTAKAVVNDPTGAAKAYIGDKVTDEAKRRVGQAGKTAAKKGGQALARAGKAAAQAVVQAARSIGVWLLGVIGPWGVVILAVVVVVGVGAALLWPSDSASNIQTVDMSKPGMVEAIDRLAALSGDPQALSKQIKEQTTDLIASLEKAKVETANAPLKADIAAELNQATALIERVRAGGTSLTTEEQTKLINALVYSLQRVPSLYRGLSLQGGSELAARAKAEVSATGSWIYSENQQPADRSKPMRDGTNQVNGKRGCNSSGFVTYLLRGDNSRCAQCISPTLDKLTVTFSLLRGIDQKNTEQDIAYQAGDILVMKAPDKTALEGYIVTSTGKTSGAAETTVAYCSVSGPKTATLKEITDTKRTVTSQVRLNTASRAESTNTGGAQ
jgi:hypothetical protein